jgi:drug/metabolite transporter (DMT)-like permease
MLLTCNDSSPVRLDDSVQGATNSRFKEKKRMFFITMSPTGWIIALVCALLLVFVPFIIVEAVADWFGEPFKSIIMIAGCFILIPMAVCYLYKRKMCNTARGSVIFWIYCGLYLLLFVFFVVRFFTEGFSLNDLLGALVLGAVSFWMISVTVKAKQQLAMNLQKQYEAEREEDIRRHAEAILLAEKMKNEQK